MVSICDQSAIERRIVRRFFSSLGKTYITNTYPVPGFELMECALNLLLWMYSGILGPRSTCIIAPLLHLFVGVSLYHSIISLFVCHFPALRVGCTGSFLPPFNSPNVAYMSHSYTTLNQIRAFYTNNFFPFVEATKNETLLFHRAFLAVPSLDFKKTTTKNNRLCVWMSSVVNKPIIKIHINYI